MQIQYPIIVIAVLLFWLVWRTLRQRQFLFAGESAPAHFVVFGLVMDLVLPVLDVAGFLMRLGS